MAKNLDECAGDAGCDTPFGTSRTRSGKDYFPELRAQFKRGYAERGISGSIEPNVRMGAIGFGLTPGQQKEIISLLDWQEESSTCNVQVSGPAGECVEY